MSEPTSFFPQPGDRAGPDGPEAEVAAPAESHPFDTPLPTADLPDELPEAVSDPDAPVDPLTAPRGSFEDFAGYEPPTFPSYASSFGAASDLADLAELRALVADLAAAEAEGRQQLTQHLIDLRQELAASRQAQATGHDMLAARIAAAAAVPAPASGSGFGSGDVTLQDIHDGLAGVRTDLASLPEQLGPAVTSAVAHGMAETSRQVAALTAALPGPPQSGAGAGLTSGGPDLQALAGLVDERVGAHLADLEARLGRHVDEAVLALAEAMLRRPTSPTRSSQAPQEPLDPSSDEVPTTAGPDAFDLAEAAAATSAEPELAAAEPWPEPVIDAVPDPATSEWGDDEEQDWEPSGDGLAAGGEAPEPVRTATVDPAPPNADVLPFEPEPKHGLFHRKG